MFEQDFTMSHDALIEALSGYVKTCRLGSVNYFNSKNQLHRIDGPAVIYPSGSVSWYRDGALHRTDGPAVIYSDGDKLWYQNGLLHRTDGPAIEFYDGSNEWHLNGIEMTEAEFNKRIAAGDYNEPRRLI